MRICNQCGAEFEDFEDFCPECGEPFDAEPEAYYEDPDDHMKTCPQCGDYIPLDSGVCPSCGYVFFKKSNKKLYTMIGIGVAALALIVILLVFLLGRKGPDVPVVDQPTAEPVSIVTQEPALDITREPTAEPTTAPAQAVPAEDNPLNKHREEAMTVFELLEPAPAGAQSVTITAVDGQTKAVGIATAESYLTKLLSLAFGSKAGFDYNLYLSDDSSWRLVMSGTLKDDQLNKMLSLDDEHIYATFRNMYLNTARSVISSTIGAQPTIMLSVYGPGKSDDDYALRLVETQPGNGTISRAA